MLQRRQRSLRIQQLLEGLLAHGVPFHIQCGLLQVREITKQVDVEVSREWGCAVANQQHDEQCEVGPTYRVRHAKRLHLPTYTEGLAEDQKVRVLDHQ